MKKQTTSMLVTLGMLVAIEIVLSRFLSIPAWNFKIGLGFVPVVMAAVLYGAVPAAIVGGLGDFLGAIMFPIGPYFPGFTLTAALTGLVWGVFLHKRQTMARIGGAVAVNQLVLSLLLNTLWISVLYGAPYGSLFLTRTISTAVMTVVQVVTIGLMTKVLGHFGRKAAV
ncbi:folate family ECF transporter S component [Oscillibacter sp.]|uniref:folate family ECF transporter S component n=1 Tax=Oscillibacter sp. TaxID=1945593 RepID=UPI00289D61CF|nr:folate family ECF transporter S component [Oscillibacter sp.]